MQDARWDQEFFGQRTIRVLHYDRHHDWRASLLDSFAAYVVAGLFSLGIDSARPIRGA